MLEEQKEHEVHVQSQHFGLLTGVAVMEPDPMSVVLAVALHGVVGEVALSHFVIGIDHNLKRKNID